MQLSKFTLFVDHYPNHNEHLVFNTRTQALIKVNQELRSILDELREERSKQEAFEYLTHERELKTLYHMGFLTKSEEEESEKLEQFMERRKYGINSTNFVATILTTYDCNLACVYCFEESTRSSKQVLKQTKSDQILIWLKNQVTKLGLKTLTLNFYGGEPLLNTDAIEHIAKNIKDWCDPRGVKVQMYLQTNGVLLTPQIVDRFLPLGLMGARISIDGTPEVHDKQRPTRGNKQGSFEFIMKNLLQIVDKIKITLAAGYDGGNPKGVIALLDYLDEKKILRKLEKFMHAPIHPSLGPKGKTDQIVSSGCMENYEPKTLMKCTAIIKEHMKKKGLVTGSGLSTSMCPVSRESGGVTIDTNGFLFKCNAMLGHPELSIGSVETGYNEKHKEFLEMSPWRKCDSDCPYKPMCNDGCKLMAFFKTKDFGAKSCEREYMDQHVPQAIKVEYQNRLRQKNKKLEPALAS